MATGSVSATLNTPDLTPVWKVPAAQWVIASLVGIALIIAFLPGLRFMVSNWEQVEEYSYGYFIPLISAFLIWQRSDQLRLLEMRASWSGLLLLGLGLMLGLIGEFSAIRLFGQYGFIVALFGLSVTFIGWRGTRLIAMPLAILFFMIPLPQFLLRELSQQLQLLSSQMGVGLIRLFGISVFLEGNVIDLGSYKLQVVEACSGLRYLFPLMVLGFLAAYFFQGSWWKRALIVLSTIPLTIVINSLRIGLIGVTVEHWGPKMAEGLLHDFEGWFMFMVCIVLLVAEMTLLARIGDKPASLRAVFGLEYPEPVARGTPIHYRRFPTPLLVGGLLLAAVGAAALWAPQREQIKPDRTPFSQFPMRLPGDWIGRPDRLDSDVLATLKVDDYLIANYAREGEPSVNFYSAYYDSQSSGVSSHSPRTCIPGGGWKITQIEETSLTLNSPQGEPATPLTVNRTVIQKGDQRQLVYYWFNQRGRTLTNEIAVKWYILHDSITRKRSDGALVRLVTQVPPDEDIAQADRRLTDFLGTVAPQLHKYIPD
ncbi:MAG: VPLPA-CTERM-specific exosortase XrtD [Pseudomonadota bacterium]|nr:VPLPA-CTERM-specific exosortase XrtD [Pseudomonadota bacterium]